MNFFHSSSELSFVNKRDFNNKNFEGLDYWQGDFQYGNKNGVIRRDENLDFLYDVYFKILCRGVGTFPSYNTERILVDLYSEQSVEERLNEKSITYDISPDIISAYKDFHDFAEPQLINPQEVEFDPEYPDNERRLFEKLIERFGPRITAFIYPQALIGSILQGNERNAFIGQRVDFLLMFPNGKGLILEPGGEEHEEPEQVRKDQARDRAFSNKGINTLRPHNREIGTIELYNKIEQELNLIDAMVFLGEPVERNKKRNEYLFLLPSLISRIEYSLIYYCLGKGMFQKEKLRIGIIEEDLACAEIALISFFERINKLIQLYSIPVVLPKIELYISRKDEQSLVVKEKIIEEIRNICEVCGDENLITIYEELSEDNFDLILDVSIKSNGLLIKHNIIQCENYAKICNTYRHNENCTFLYLSTPKSVSNESNVDELLTSFLSDFFRKRIFRNGQLPIIKSILGQKNTIGLLPTSGGKSICYQISSLLTPGITVVIDPIVALMQDQVKGMINTYRITRVFAWYAGEVVGGMNAESIFRENLMVFISPERFLVVSFREALRNLAGANIYVNYTVADEAHSVSMWGHDFRPAYLSLERHIREYFTFGNRPPVIVGLTGTASQLVLIDLKIELGVNELDATVRPDSFDRPELIFRIFKCRSNEKLNTLNRQIIPWVEGRGGLETSNLLQSQWGLIFRVFPNTIYRLFSEFINNEVDFVNAGVSGRMTEMLYGIYCGKKPNGLEQLNNDQWKEYKENVISAFKQGDMHLLIGNKSVGVGLDNEKLNWVVNYEMPTSLEEYYQACGRAGRSGQRSPCALIFSDDNPIQTDRWLRGEEPTENVGAPRRWDDIGIAAKFHGENFPGKDIEIEEAYHLLARVLREKEEYECLLANTSKNTEKYILYWIILGIFTDYTKSGMNNNTEYTVGILNDVNVKDSNLLEGIVLDSLCKYLSRYKPVNREDILLLINNESGNKFSERALRYLISFIYDNIERQRKVSIQTMREYCNTEDGSSDNLRRILKATFDRSAFSDRLEAMTQTVPNFELVNDIIREIEGFDDVERLYWETNQLSSQGLFRADWGAINLFASLYRNNVVSENLLAKFIEIIDSLDVDSQTSGEPAKNFITSLLLSLLSINQMAENVKSNLIVKLIDVLYNKYALKYIPVIDDINGGENIGKFIKLCVKNKQLSKLIKNILYERTRTIRKN